MGALPVFYVIAFVSLLNYVSCIENLKEVKNSTELQKPDDNVDVLIFNKTLLSINDTDSKNENTDYILEQNDDTAYDMETQTFYSKFENIAGNLNISGTDDFDSNIKENENPTELYPVQINATGTNNKFPAESSNSTSEDLEEIEVDYYDDLEKETNLTDYDINTGNSVRLLGATDVTDIGLYPYAVYLDIDTGLSTARGCTGAIIATNYILTAASCVNNAALINVYAGDISPFRVVVPPATGPVPIPGSAIIHPKFISNTLHHDVALVKLRTPLTISGTINIIKLARKQNMRSAKDFVGKSFRILGFSDNNVLLALPVLRYVRMSGLSHYQCYKAFRSNHFKPATTQTCLDTENGVVGMCTNSDVGGPVTYKFKGDSQFTLVGVMNYYETCASSSPNMFTRVGPYLDFIEKFVPNFVNEG